MIGTNADGSAAKYTASFLSYLVDNVQSPDTNLVKTFVNTYSWKEGKASQWPPQSLLGGNSLSNNIAIKTGLTVFYNTSQSTQLEIQNTLKKVDDLTDSLIGYQTNEAAWLSGQWEFCAALDEDGKLLVAKTRVDECFTNLEGMTNVMSTSMTNLSARYAFLKQTAISSSMNAFEEIENGIPDVNKTSGLFGEILAELQSFKNEAAGNVQTHFDKFSNWVDVLDRDQLSTVGDKTTAQDLRWSLYDNACALAHATVTLDDSVIGDRWKRFGELKTKADEFRIQLASYNGPLADLTSNACQRIAGDAEKQVQTQFVKNYVSIVGDKLAELANPDEWRSKNAPDATNLLGLIGQDLQSADEKFDQSQLIELQPVSANLLKIAMQIHDRLGFPVLLNANSDHPMNLDDLIALRNELEPLSSALANPAWTGIMDEKSRTQAQDIEKNLKNYDVVVGALVASDGSPATIQIFFVPPKEGENADAAIIRDFRQAKITIDGTGTDWQELSTQIGESESLTPILEGSVNQGLSISFRKLAADNLPQTILDEPNWGLLRLIHDGSAQLSDDGVGWIIPVKLVDPQQSISGTAQFRIRLKSEALPKVSDWPGQ